MAKGNKAKTEGTEIETEDKGFQPELDVVVAEFDLSPAKEKGKILARIMCYNGNAKKFTVVQVGQKGKVYTAKRIGLEEAKLLPKAIEQFTKDGVL